MTSIRSQAIGLTFPRQSYTVTQDDARLPDGAVSPSVAMVFAFGALEELSDPRLASRPIRVFADLYGGAVELRATPTPIHIGDVISTVGRVADAAVLSEGERFVVDTASQNQHGDIVCEARFTFVLPTNPVAGRAPAVPPEDDDLENGRVGAKRTVMGRFDFVRIVEHEKLGMGGPEIDAFRAGIDTLLEILGGDPTRLRRVKGNIVGVPPEGHDLIVHGRRDKKRTGFIVFEVASHGGLVLVADGLAEISQ